MKLIVKDMDERLVEGFASVEIEDAQSDIVPVEEMKRAMIKFMDRGGHLVYGHGNKIVGKVLSWWIDKNEATGKLGVKILAKINKDYAIDDAVWKAIKEGKIKGFSIGGHSEKELKVIKENGQSKEVSVLRNIQLGEISLVENPANLAALIEDINEFAKSVSIIDKYGVDKEMFDLEKATINECEVCEVIKEDYKNEVASVIYGQSYDLLSSIEKSIVDGVMDKFTDMLALMGAMVSKEEVEKELEVSDESVKELIGKEIDYVMGEIEKAKYPWEQCIRDMKERYGREERARRICGAIRWRAQRKKEMMAREKELKDALENVRKMAKEIESVVKRREAEKEIEKTLSVIDEILLNLKKEEINELLKEMEEIKKPNDLRPPKEFWDRCMDKLNNERLCGWVYYHHLRPKPPKGAEDEPSTREARQRKREWLSQKKSDDVLDRIMSKIARGEKLSEEEERILSAAIDAVKDEIGKS